MKSFVSSRMALGVAAAATSLVLLAGCDRRPTDVPPPTTDETQRDRTTNPPMPPSAPAVPVPETTPAPPASSPATPAPGGTTQ
ncbi:hypothetical protein [Hydrogenophaga sp.]|uniref:hypothetical protein n=1 Tax=Hydrogenophaga sp. TaxID=1904254 RepID=UPI0025C0AA84|nr:hypothetical protein [Hydrogenophaga sp.]